jgi:hypothetical protein
VASDGSRLVRDICLVVIRRLLWRDPRARWRTQVPASWDRERLRRRSRVRSVRSQEGEHGLSRRGGSEERDGLPSDDIRAVVVDRGTVPLRYAVDPHRVVVVPTVGDRRPVPACRLLVADARHLIQVLPGDERVIPDVTELGHDRRVSPMVWVNRRPRRTYRALICPSRDQMRVSISAMSSNISTTMFGLAPRLRLGSRRSRTRAAMHR